MTLPGGMTAYGLQKLEEWEGRRAFVYDDADGNKPYVRGAEVKGTLTAGVGHTGRDVAQWIGKRIPDEVIDAWRDADVAEAAHIVDRAVKVPLTEHQRDALISFVFNVGPGRKGVKDGFVTLGSGRPSTLLRELNAGNLEAVPVELAKWVKSKGKRNPGLVNRRAAEIGLWSKGSFVASRTVAAEPPKPTPAVRDPGVLGGAAVVVLGGIGAASQVIEAAGDAGKVAEPLLGPLGPYAVPAAVFLALSVLGCLWVFRANRRREREAA